MRLGVSGKKNRLTGENKCHEKVSIPKAIKEIVFPIFKDLRDSELLEECLHGHNQQLAEQNNLAEMPEKPLSIKTIIRNWSNFC